MIIFQAAAITAIYNVLAKVKCLGKYM